MSSLRTPAFLDWFWPTMKELRDTPSPALSKSIDALYTIFYETAGQADISAKNLLVYHHGQLEFKEYQVLTQAYLLLGNQHITNRMTLLAKELPEIVKPSEAHFRDRDKVFAGILSGLFEAIAFLKDPIKTETMVYSDQDSCQGIKDLFYRRRQIHETALSALKTFIDYPWPGLANPRLDKKDMSVLSSSISRALKKTDYGLYPEVQSYVNQEDDYRRQMTNELIKLVTHYTKREHATDKTPELVMEIGRALAYASITHMSGYALMYLATEHANEV